jgi:multiple sugar transport system ATP-binding protein
MARVVLTNVSKAFQPGAAPAVDDCSLEVADKEFVVLVGPSGCGKSTTLRMIAGLEQPTSGEIAIGERVVNDLPPKDRDIAMVFQNYALYPHMTVYKNMAFGLMLRKMPKPEIDRRVRAAAEILGISDLLDRRPKALSGGQRQRVAVGRAIVRQPQVFLLDEPLSNLDAKMRASMRAELSKLHDRLEATMIYVTHDQVEAMTMGDRIVVMNGGRVQQIDTPMGLYERPVNRFVAGFIGSPAMNFFEGRLVDESGTLYFEKGAIRFPVAAQHRAALQQAAAGGVTLGLRPEHFAMANGASKGAAPDANYQPLRAHVEVVEPMGAETFVNLTAEGQTLVARLDAHAALATGADIDLLADLSKAHWFDALSGTSIRREGPQ